MVGEAFGELFDFLVDLVGRGADMRRSSHRNGLRNLNWPGAASDATTLVVGVRLFVA